jgi:hypothetical protein
MFKTDKAYPASSCQTTVRRLRLLQNSLVLFSRMKPFKNTWLTKEASGFSTLSVHRGGVEFLNK